MSNPWQLYDDLIDALPQGLLVTGALISHFACVSTEAGVGVAMGEAGGPRAPWAERQVVGRDIRTVAALAKSWDLELASLGVAAMNAWFNTEQRVRKYRLVGGESGCFELYSDAVARRRVAVVGHFGGFERLARASDLIVLEREPRESDLPDPACEYVLADREDVFLTGVTLTNKTMPRLLDLASGARVVLLGPTAPFAPEVYGERVSAISGSWVSNDEMCWSMAGAGARMRDMKQVLNRYNAVFDGETYEEER